MQIFIKREGVRLIVIGSGPAESGIWRGVTTEPFKEIEPIIAVPKLSIDYWMPSTETAIEFEKRLAKQDADQKRDEKLRRAAQRSERRNRH